jgi:hypothetical protein
MNIIQLYEAEQIARLTASRGVPDFVPGDTVRVAVKVVEGERTRTQAFEGVCIKRDNGLQASFTVRKISYRGVSGGPCLAAGRRMPWRAAATCAGQVALSTWSPGNGDREGARTTGSPATPVTTNETERRQLIAELREAVVQQSCAAVRAKIGVASVEWLGRNHSRYIDRHPLRRPARRRSRPASGRAAPASI